MWPTFYLTTAQLAGREACDQYGYPCVLKAHVTKPPQLQADSPHAASLKAFVHRALSQHHLQHTATEVLSTLDSVGLREDLPEAVLFRLQPDMWRAVDDAAKRDKLITQFICLKRSIGVVPAAAGAQNTDGSPSRVGLSSAVPPNRLMTVLDLNETDNYGLNSDIPAPTIIAEDRTTAPSSIWARNPRVADEPEVATPPSLPLVASLQKENTDPIAGLAATKGSNEAEHAARTVTVALAPRALAANQPKVGRPVGLDGVDEFAVVKSRRTVKEVQECPRHFQCPEGQSCPLKHSEAERRCFDRFRQEQRHNFKTRLCENEIPCHKYPCCGFFHPGKSQDLGFCSHCYEWTDHVQQTCPKL